MGVSWWKGYNKAMCVATSYCMCLTQNALKILLRVKISRVLRGVYRTTSTTLHAHLGRVGRCGPRSISQALRIALTLLSIHLQDGLLALLHLQSPKAGRKGR